MKKAFVIHGKAALSPARGTNNSTLWSWFKVVEGEYSNAGSRGFSGRTQKKSSGVIRSFFPTWSWIRFL